MTPEDAAAAHVSAYPAILKGREGKMNGQIIRYLALNGPSLIYSVAKDLASRSQTKIHYPTVNRRIHDLTRRGYVEKAGTRTTKAGAQADLYTTRLRGDFATLAGIPDSPGSYTAELSPKELYQMITIASARQGSPFLLFKNILEEGQGGKELVDKELVPEIINGVRNGFLNIDALDEGVLSTAFASLISRRIIALMEENADTDTNKNNQMKTRDQLDIITRSLEKIMTSVSSSSEKGTAIRKAYAARRSSMPNAAADAAQISYQWTKELMVFLKLRSLRIE